MVGTPKVFFAPVDERAAKAAKIPSYMSGEAAGADIFAFLEKPVILKPFERFAVPTGFKIAIERGFEGQVRPRSGLALKKGLTVANAPGTIDSDYRGELKVILINLSSEAVTIETGERIAQLVISPVARAEMKIVNELPVTERGEGGFGSTGF
ncbi:MAG: dUTP diphosphatase [Phycisphaerae bacterium]|nr:dUTP diphosphatase [Phycisphaerae bacterium]